jgi:DNA-binding CsgD family transcriptional regulator
MSVSDDPNNHPTARAVAPPTIPALTAAEQALLHWLATGRTNAQIGQCLGRSEKTVRNQLTRVYGKLGAANRTQAVAMLLRSGLGNAP